MLVLLAKYKFLLISAAAIFLSISISSVHAAIQYGGGTYQSSYAASTTQAVGNVVNDVVSGNLNNPLSGSSTLDTAGAVSGAVGFFNRVNTWLKEKAGIDFAAILKAIGHFFVIVVQFVVELVKKLL